MYLIDWELTRYTKGTWGKQASGKH